MLIENEFEVPAPIDRVWAYLLDVEKVAPCMPGAELTETIDERSWKGKVAVKFGPVALSFAGTVTMQERDDDAHRVKLVAKGMESKGKGAAHADVTSWLEPGAGVTQVKMRADITLTGAVAQLSRGLLPDISAKLTGQFADCLHTNIQAEEDAFLASEPAPAPIAAAEPVGGFRLGLWAMWRSLARAVGRLFRRGPAK